MTNEQTVQSSVHNILSNNYNLSDSQIKRVFRSFPSEVQIAAHIGRSASLVATILMDKVAVLKEHWNDDILNA